MENNKTSLARTITIIFSSKIVNNLTESIIHSHRRLINILYFEVVRVCSFVCCNGVCKSGLSSTKTKFEWYTPTRHKKIQFSLFSLNSSSFCYAIYGTNVQIERTWKDSPRAYICCKTEIKTSLALSLRTDCLRKFRY